jgi:hypothetical protein
MTSVQVSLSLVLVAYEGEAREGKFMGPGETAVVGSEGPIQRTRERGVNGSRKKFFSKEMKAPTRRTRLPTHVSDSLLKLAKST